MGYEMVMTLNTAYPGKLSYDKDWHFTFISAVGPLITLLQGFVFYLLIKKTHRKNLFPFLFSCFYVELLSGIMNVSKPNDLGRIGRSFELGLFTLPVIFILIHLFMMYRTSRREQYSRNFLIFSFIMILIFSSIWILTNQQINIVLIR